MIELDITKPKNFKFDINIDGVNPDVLIGFLRLEMSGIEYGFPATVTKDSISVDIPSLKNIVNREIKNGEKIKARLDIVGEGNYIVPWDEELMVKSTVIIEAKLVNSNKPIIQLKKEKKIEPKKLLTKEKILKKGITSKKIVKEKEEKLPEITKDMVIRYMEKNGTTNKNIQNLLYENAVIKLGDNPKTLLKFFITFYKKNLEKLK